MKKFLTFLLGMIAGALLCLGVLYFMGNSTGNDNDALTLFEQPGDVISTKPFKVFQVDASGNALATENSNAEYGWYNGMVVLFLAEDGVSYYDEQIIKVPSGKCVRQLGTYRYITTSNTVKTVPAVALRNK